MFILTIVFRVVVTKFGTVVFVFTYVISEFLAVVCVAACELIALFQTRMQPVLEIIPR